MKITLGYRFALAGLLWLAAGCDQNSTPAQPAAPSAAMPGTTDPQAASRFGGPNGAPPTLGGGPANGAPGGGGAMTGSGMAGGAPMAGAPFAGHGGKKLSLTEALAAAPKLDPSLMPLKKAYDSAAADLKKKPGDPTVKAAYVNAAYSYGHAVEYSDKLADPPTKYRAALLLYRNALAVDPNHKPSSSEKGQIEQIYQSMGLPVPQ